MNATKRHTTIGSINACIAGDYRYSTKVHVIFQPSEDSDLLIDGTYIVQRLENGAVGGMDGPGGATGFVITGSITFPTSAPAKEMVEAVRCLCDDTIQRYGKPSKNFQWLDGRGGYRAIAEGISVAKAKKAFAAHAKANAEAVASAARFAEVSS